MYTELEEPVGQVPLERLTLFSVIRMQGMLPILSKFWKELIKMSLLKWHHVVVGWKEGGACGALALQDVMSD